MTGMLRSKLGELNGDMEAVSKMGLLNTDRDVVW